MFSSIGSLGQFVRPLENKELQKSQDAGERKAADKLFKSLEQMSPMELAKVKTTKMGPADLINMTYAKSSNLRLIA